MSTAARGRRAIILALLAVAALLVLADTIDTALAQGSPFGMPRSQAPAAPMGGMLGWIFAKQAQFYRQFSGLIRAAKSDGSAVWGLLGLSFLYGIFHAAGPGHGKAVISSYLVANGETWRRGVALSFASALLQALAAIVLVAIAAMALHATASTMRGAVNAIEIMSYALIVLIGLRLLWVKGRAFLIAAQTLHRPVALSAAATPVLQCVHHHGHAPHVHAHSERGPAADQGVQLADPAAYRHLNEASLFGSSSIVRGLLQASRQPEQAMIHVALRAEGQGPFQLRARGRWIL